MAELTEASDIRVAVRAKYAAAATTASTEAGCCGPGSVTCSPADAEGAFGAALYGEVSSADIPEAAINASLGCGVPTAVADLAEGETVLDLGSGAGADVLISARRVGPTSKAIGLDMTDEMLELARANATEAGVDKAAIIRARKPAPSVSSAACSLDAAERAAQLERYRALGLHAAEVEHQPGRVLVRFFDDPPASVLERTLEVERGCCPFFDIEYEPVGRRLVIAVEDPEGAQDLDAIAAALMQSRATGSLPLGDAPAAPGQLVTTCCSPTVLETCCEPQANEDCCGHDNDEPPSRCGCR